MQYLKFNQLHLGTDVTEAPSNRLPLDPITFWVIIGILAAVALTMTLCFLIVCCYCTCFSVKRTKYAVQKGMTIGRMLKVNQQKHCNQFMVLIITIISNVRHANVVQYIVMRCSINYRYKFNDD